MAEDASWSAVGIPVQQLPSLVVAHGILDSVASLHCKQLPELIASARRMGVPLEQKPDREEAVRVDMKDGVDMLGELVRCRSKLKG